MTSFAEKSQEVNAKRRMDEIQKAIDVSQTICDKCGSAAVFVAYADGKKLLMDTIPNPKGGWHVIQGFPMERTCHATNYGWGAKDVVPRNERRTAHKDTCPNRVPPTLEAS